MLAINDEAQSRYLIELEPGVDLTGVVVFADRSAVPRETLVLAWPAGHTPSSDVVRRAIILGEPQRMFRCEPTDEGRFRIAGLPHGSRWTLSAAGLGAFSAERVEVDLNASARVEILLNAAYGVIVRLRQEGQQRLLTNPRLFGIGPTTRCLDATVSGVMGTPLELIVAAPQIPDGVSRNSRDDQILLYTTLDRRAMVGPIEYDVRVPGYRMASAEVFAGSLESEIAEVTVNPQGENTEWGALRIRALNTRSAASMAIPENAPVGLVVLSDSKGQSCNLAAHWRETELLQDIPCETYEYRFQAFEGYFRIPSLDGDRPTTVVCPHPGEVILDMGGVGAVEVQLQHANGALYDGAAVVRCTDMTSGGVFFTGWERAPYVLNLILPGEYLVRAETLEGVDVATIEPAVAYVVPNEIFLCSIAIPGNP